MTRRNFLMIDLHTPLSIFILPHTLEAASLTVFCSGSARVGNGPQVSLAGRCLSAGPGRLGLSAGLTVGVLGPGSWCQVVVGARTRETRLNPPPHPEPGQQGLWKRRLTLPCLSSSIPGPCLRVQGQTAGSICWGWGVWWVRRGSKLGALGHCFSNIFF